MVSARALNRGRFAPAPWRGRAASGEHTPAQDAGDTGVRIVRVVPVLDGIALDGEDARGGRDVPAGLVDVADDGGSEVELLRQTVELGEEAKASAHGGYSDSSGNEVLVESCQLSCRFADNCQQTRDGPPQHGVLLIVGEALVGGECGDNVRACSMSYRNFRASSCIKQDAGLVNSLLEVRISHG